MKISTEFMFKTATKRSNFASIGRQREDMAVDTVICARDGATHCYLDLKSRCEAVVFPLDLCLFFSLSPRFADGF